jgi:ABC-type polysaccharide/polyol phosphate transport system ATPase subunit
MRMGLGIISLKEMIEILQFRWFGHVLRMWGERCSRIAWLSAGKETQNKTPTDLGRRYKKDFEGKRN